MKTKIVATLGPASHSCEVLSRLIAAGVRIFRLNFSHGDASTFADLIATIRGLEEVHDVPVTIMQDLSGPKLRIGDLRGDAFSVQKGARLLLGPDALYREDLPYIPFDHEAVLAELEPGDRLVLADGSLGIRIVGREPDGVFTADAVNTGVISSRKGLAFPGKSVRVPALTAKDKKDLVEGLSLGVDAVALSYVQTPEDIREAKAIMRSRGKNVPVVAKLERRNAVERLDAILEETDIVMVARGDLGIECPLPELPAMQKRIIRACNRAHKPVIVATQMLLSMVSSPSPTRAETTDVANAVLDGADCIMLSDETAVGNFPVETVRVMWEIAAKAEELMQETPWPDQIPRGGNPAELLAYSARMLADMTGAKAIVTHTASGLSARRLSSRKPSQAIFALTPNHSVYKALNFSWGVLPHLVPEDHEHHLIKTEKFVDQEPCFAHDDTVIITAGQPSPTNPTHAGTNLVKIYRK